MGAPKNQVLALVAAVSIPLVAFAAFLIFAFTTSQQQELKRSSGARAEEVARLAEATALSELRIAQVLATATSIRHDDFAAAYARAKEVAEVSGYWRTAILSDPDAGLQLFDTRDPYLRVPHKILPLVADIARQGLAKAVIGGVEADGRGTYMIPLHIPITRNGHLKYILTVGLNPDEIQQTAGRRLQGEGVGAVVDRNGRFIARTLDYEHRVGTPATHYVRDAIRKQPSGTYQGVTYEGVPNYTAYFTAPETGWSVHLAVKSSKIDQPRLLSAVSISLAALGCLVLAGLLLFYVLRDLDRVRVEEERKRQSQKMEAVGQLTGGIAHDFNNLLMAIIGGVEIYLRRSSSDDPYRHYLDGVMDAARRGAKLTAKLLAFSRVQRLSLTVVDLRSALEGMSDLLDHTLGPNIKVSRHVAPDARWVRTDANQLELAFLNLAINARDAMPDGGDLMFSVELAPVGGNPKGEARQVVIRVTDTGAGMPRKVAERAFEPFFTTKGENKGTGLGLAQVFEVARQSGGTASIQSSPGEGTTVSILLPLVASAEEVVNDPSHASGPESAERSAFLGKRILVLDDEAPVRRVLVENLRLRGYVVFEAETGEEALAALASIDPDLLMVDFLMPGMDGAEVARRARQARPHQRLLIVSGHFDNAALEAVAGDIPILKKPCDGPALAAAVASALE